MGAQPKPITGKRRPDPTDEASADRADAAVEIFQDIWVEHPPQMLINRRIRRYLLKEAHVRGRPLTGRRLSQYSQAGKSATMTRFIRKMLEEEIAAGRQPNPLRILHVTIDKRETVKQFYQKLLKLMGDDFIDAPQPHLRRSSSDRSDRPRSTSRDNVTILEQRIADWVVRLGVELIIVDEVQRLARVTDDANEVTQRLQSFLDRGIVGMVFVGNHESEEFFDKNGEFAVRLLEPLELRPLRGTAGRKMFADFCGDFDRQLENLGATSISSELTAEATIEALLAVSGGHVGRVARLLEVALPAALERGAASIEPYDLSNAVRSFAIPKKWIDHDPFERQP